MASARLTMNVRDSISELEKEKAIELGLGYAEQ